MQRKAQHVHGRHAAHAILAERIHARTVSATLRRLPMTTFPQGALRTAYNSGCENASEDRGTREETQALFGLNGEAEGAAIERVKGAEVRSKEEFWRMWRGARKVV